MIIKNVKVYTEDKTFVPGEVAVADGKFAAEAAADSEVLDGEGCYMIPVVCMEKTNIRYVTARRQCADDRK